MMRLRRSHQPGGQGNATTPGTGSGPDRTRQDRAASVSRTLNAKPSVTHEAAGPREPGPVGSLRNHFLRWRVLLVPLLAGVIVLVTGLVVIGHLPTRYSATSTISFTPRPKPVSDANVIELIASKYAVVASSTRTVHSAASAAAVTPDRLRDALSVKVQPKTGNLEIAVALGKARQSATAANAIASVVNKAADNDRLVFGEVTARADAEAVQLQPSRSLLRVITVAAALLAAGWAGVVMRQVVRRGAERKP